jgi:hypothetical protein
MRSKALKPRKEGYRYLEFNHQGLEDDLQPVFL